MHHSISFQHGVSIRFTVPHSSDQLLTIQLADQAATLGLEEAEKLYWWLHQHREAFISFYGEGWELARTYWQRDAAPDTYAVLLNLFNAHCHEINVSPYREGDTGPSEQAVNGFFAGMAALAEGSDGVFTSRRILAYAEQYARTHWEVSEARAHLSLTGDGMPEPGDRENSYLVCLDMRGVGDIQRIVGVVNQDGTLERDHTYMGDAGCHACEYGKVREYLPAASEESEEQP
jgi:hypothetical protein